MSSPRDVMPDDTRKALHDAVAKAPVAQSTGPAELDVYRREAAALLTPGLPRDQAAQRIEARMALEPVEGTGESACVMWPIVQSLKYNRLDVHFHNDALVSWDLRIINGAAGV